MNIVGEWIRKQWITKKIAYDLIRKQIETDSEKVENRLKACNQCKFNKEGICLICTCIIEVKVSSRTNWNKNTLQVEITHCPKGLWPGEEDVTNMYL